MNNIFLTGFMGTGKSAVGRELARRLRRPFVDLDEEIERRAGTTIAEIFRVRGEAAFRLLERESLDEIGRRDEAVIATGGGAVLDPANRERMAASGIVVCLDAEPEVVLERVGCAQSRPLLAGAAEPLERVRSLLREREASYARADLRVPTSRRTPAEVAAEIAAFLAAPRSVP